MKIRPVGTELFYVEKQTDKLTDTTKLRIGFRNYTNALNVQSFNAVQGNNRFLSSDPNETHKYTVWAGFSVMLSPSQFYLILPNTTYLYRNVFQKLCYEKTVSIPLLMF